MRMEDDKVKHRGGAEFVQLAVCIPDLHMIFRCALNSMLESFLFSFYLVLFVPCWGSSMFCIYGCLYGGECN